MLVLINDEAELAGVLGHEIAHVAAKHAVRQVSRAAPLAVITGLGAFATGIVSPALGNAVGGIGGAAGALLLAPYSREQEHEADVVGQDMVAKAGWDPTGLSRALRTLERDEAARGDESRATDFFATHPPLPRRVADTEAHAKELARGIAAPIAGGRREFLRRLEGLVVGPRAADGVFDGRTFLHPDLGFHVRFPSGWKTANERSMVAAGEPNDRAAVAVEMEGDGNDPEVPLRALEQKSGVPLSAGAERRTVNGLRAIHTTAQARTRDGHVALDLTWIAYGGHVYRVTGGSAPADADAVRPAFRATADSFGALTAAERASIQELRLDVVAARSGDNLPRLLARTSSPWTPETASIANGIEPTTALITGDPIKVAVQHAYSARSR
jgi:predicted Zn-dependent protease